MTVALDLAETLGHDTTRGQEMARAVDKLARSFRWVDIGEQAHCINVFVDQSSIVLVRHREGELTWFSADSEARKATSATGAELSRLRVENDRLAGVVRVREREVADVQKRLDALIRAVRRAQACHCGRTPCERVAEVDRLVKAESAPRSLQ